MFPKGEAARCPHCDVDLVALSKLTPLEDDDDDELAKPTTTEGAAPVAGEDDKLLSWTHAGHGRGLLVLFAALGLVAFALPWASMTAPELRQFSGLDIAKRAPVAWAAGVAWFTLLPLVLSRRTVNKMLGARLAVGVLSIMPIITAGALLANPPKGVEARGFVIPFQFTWQPAIYATLALGIASALVGILYFGGFVPLRAQTPSR